MFRLELGGGSGWELASQGVYRLLPASGFIVSFVGGLGPAPSATALA